MLAEHDSNLFCSRARLYFALTSKVFTFRRVYSAGKRESAFGVYFHITVLGLFWLTEFSVYYFCDDYHGESRRGCRQQSKYYFKMVDLFSKA